MSKQTYTGMVMVDGSPMRASEYMRQQRRERIDSKIVGCIYLIRCGDSNYYKIGQSRRAFANRLAMLQVGCPYNLELMFALKVTGYLAAEHDLHERYDLQHVRGEWFELSPEDVADIQEYLTNKLETWGQ